VDFSYVIIRPFATPEHHKQSLGNIFIVETKQQNNNDELKKRCNDKKRKEKKRKESEATKN
jgi:hypothetical protein